MLYLTLLLETFYLEAKPTSNTTEYQKPSKLGDILI